MMKAQIETNRHVEPRRIEDTVRSTVAPGFRTMGITGAVTDGAAVLRSGNTTTTSANLHRFGPLTLAVLAGGDNR